MSDSCFKFLFKGTSEGGGMANKATRACYNKVFQMKAVTIIKFSKSFFIWNGRSSPAAVIVSISNHLCRCVRHTHQCVCCASVWSPGLPE